MRVMKSLEDKLRSEQCARILAALEDGAKSPDELVGLTKLTAGSVAKHVDVLIEAGRIRRIARGRFSLRR
jgi:DNA-binding MarR family transcriptional regulator